MEHILRVVNENSEYIFDEEMDIPSIEYLKKSKDNIVIDSSNYKIWRVAIELVNGAIITNLYVTRCD